LRARVVPEQEKKSTDGGAVAAKGKTKMRSSVKMLMPRELILEKKRERGFP